jgi:hypothetical protein
MSSVRRIITAGLLVGCSVVFVIVLGLAMQRILDTGGDEPGEGDSTAVVGSDTIPPPAGPRTTSLIPLDDEGGTVTCYRAGGGDYAGSFVVQVSASERVPDELTVGVDLLADDRSRQGRAVVVPTDPEGGVVTVVVPDSNTFPPFSDCSVTAIQRDQRVTLTDG